MKKFCRYAVIAVDTGNPLILGYKWKDFDCCSVRYVNAGTFKTFPLFGRTITKYFRTLMVNNIPCVAVFWADAKQEKLRNCVTLTGQYFGLRGREYFVEPVSDSEVYLNLIAGLGVAYENV